MKNIFLIKKECFLYGDLYIGLVMVDGGNLKVSDIILKKLWIFFFIVYYYYIINNVRKGCLMKKNKMV